MSRDICHKEEYIRTLSCF